MQLSLVAVLEISIVRKLREHRDSNPGRLLEKPKRYLCAMPSPIGVGKLSLHGGL